MVTKIVQLEFANSKINAVDYIQDIRKAVESASLNLYSRYGVKLQYPYLTSDGKVLLEIKIPEKIVKDFSIGNHLRGISNYLLRRNGDCYRDFLVGKRLLNYIELPSNYSSQERMQVDRFEVVSSFIKLLERTDDEAMDYISRITILIEEATK